MEPKNRPPHPGEDRCPGCDIRIVDAGGEAPTALYLDSQGKVTDAEGTWVCSNCIDSGFGGTTGPGVRGLGGAGGGPGARFTTTGKSLPSTADMRREGPAEQRARRLAAELLVTEDKLTEARRQVRELAGIVGALRRALCLHIDKPDADVVGEVARYIACAAQAEHTRDRLLRLAEAARDARDWTMEALDELTTGPKRLDVAVEPLRMAHNRLELFGLGDGEEGEQPAPECTGEVAVADETRETRFVEAFYLSGDRTGLRFEGTPDLIVTDADADRLALVLSTGGELQRYEGPGALPLTIREMSRTLEIRIGFDTLAERITDAYVLPEVVVTNADHLAHEMIERLKVNDGDAVIDGLAAEVYSDIPWNELEPLGLRAVDDSEDDTHEPGDDFEPLSGDDEEDDGDA